MNEKMVGYLLLVVGVLVIIVAGLNIYMVFTGSASAVKVFNFSGVSIDSSQLISLPPEQAALIEPNKMEIISGDVLSQTTNLFAHTIFMGFIASIGFRIGKLGVYMLRPVVVRLKDGG